MQTIEQLVPVLLEASPLVLSLLIGLLAIGVAGFALYVVHAAIQSRGDR